MSPSDPAARTDEPCRWCTPASEVPEHPTIPGTTRHLIDVHHSTGQHDTLDEIVTIPVRAVQIDACGPAVELGPWSFSPDQARLLGTSLQLLADVLEPGRAR